MRCNSKRQSVPCAAVSPPLADFNVVLCVLCGLCCKPTAMTRPRSARSGSASATASSSHWSPKTKRIAAGSRSFSVRATLTLPCNALVRQQQPLLQMMTAGDFSAAGKCAFTAAAELTLTPAAVEIWAALVTAARVVAVRVAWHCCVNWTCSCIILSTL